MFRLASAILLPCLGGMFSDRSLSSFYVCSKPSRDFHVNGEMKHHTVRARDGYHDVSAFGWGGRSYAGGKGDWRGRVAIR